MSNGKVSAQSLTQGLAKDTIFYPLVSIDLNGMRNPASYIMPASSNEWKPDLQLEHLLYGPEVDAFLQILNSDCFITVLLGFRSFVGAMSANFEYDLKHKNPAALLVLLHWYAKLNPIPVWWLKARTTLEGQAICIYLARYHGRDPRIERQLRWPASILFCMR